MKIKLRSMYDSFPEQYGDGNGQVNFYVDNNVYYLDNTDMGATNAIALLVEPRAIIPGTYTWIEENYEKFRYVFTFDNALLKLPNAKLLIYGQITAEFPDTPKTKAISMVASNKDFCEGHRNRQMVASVLSDRIDTYGRFNGGGYCNDNDYLSEHMFNVAMENSSDGYYFTEKICNCLASKVIPIYWGCPNIEKFFDMDGIIYVPDWTHIPTVVNEVLQDPEGIYESKRSAIERNFHLVQRYRSYAKLFLETYGGLLEGIAK